MALIPKLCGIVVAVRPHVGYLDHYYHSEIVLEDTWEFMGFSEESKSLEEHQVVLFTSIPEDIPFLPGDQAAVYCSPAGTPNQWEGESFILPERERRKQGGDQGD